MNKQKNKKNLPYISVAQQPSAIPELTPASAEEPIHDFPHQDPTAESGPSHNEIAVRAHEIYVEEGRPQGQSDEIWRRAKLEQRYKNVAALRAKIRG